MSIKTAAIYCRVSTQEQAEHGYSIGEQEERLRDYCRARGWVVSKAYVDAGYSGAKTDRPALQELMKDIKRAHAPDIVIVWKLDRLSRSQKDTLYLVEDVFGANNVDFVSMNENFDTSTPFGKAMVGILSVFAQLEREQIKERMGMGSVARAKSGLFHGGGNIPIGYDYVDGQLLVNEYEAMQVRKIFEMFNAGESLHGIWRIFEERGYHTKFGSWPSSAAIRRTLLNPIYIGLVGYKKKRYPGQHEPIITEEVFNTAQERMKKMKASRQITPYRAASLLGGFVWCNRCGARYSIRRSRRKSAEGHEVEYGYYACYSRSNSNRAMSKGSCDNKNWKVADLDEHVICEIEKLSFDRSMVNTIAGVDEEDNSIDNESAALQNRIGEIEGQIKRLLDLCQFDVGSPIQEIYDRIKALQKERDQLEQEISELTDDSKINNLKEIHAILDTAPEVLRNSDDLAQKRQIITSLIESIAVDGDELFISWAF